MSSLLLLFALSGCTHRVDATDSSSLLSSDTGPILQPPGPIEHILLVTNDTLRPDMVSQDTMPLLVGRMTEGIVLRNEWNVGNWTMHTMPGVMTGKTVVDLGPAVYQQQLPVVGEEESTLAEILSMNGFATYWDNGNSLAGSQVNMLQGYNHVVERNHDDPGDFGNAGDQGNRMVEWVRTQETSWFGHIHTIDTHDPYNAPADSCNAAVRALTPACPYDIIEGSTDDMNNVELSAEEHNACAQAVEAAHRCEATLLDTLLEEFLVQMETEGFLEKTLLVVTLDHGEGWGEHSWNHHRDLYAPVTRGLTWFWYPGVDELVFVDQATSQIDLVPTILSLANLTAPVVFDGSPIDALPQDRVVKQFACDPQEKRHGSISADGTRHLLMSMRDAGDTWELYDPINDPFELNPLTETPSTDLVAAIEAQRIQTESYCP